MIESERDEPSAPRHDCIVSELISDHYGPLLDATDTEDRHLRLINDREADDGAEDARVGNGEGATLHLLRCQLLPPSSLRQVIDPIRHAHQRQLIGSLHHGHDEALWESDSNADVDRLAVDNIRTRDRSVQFRMLPQRQSHGTCDERRVADAYPLRLPPLTMEGSQLVHPRVIHLDVRMRVRGDPL